MIEKMKKVCVVSTLSKKDQMLEGLRELGILHLSEKKDPERETAEKLSVLSKTASTLSEYSTESKEKKKKEKEITKNVPVLSEEEFKELYDKVLASIDEKSALNQKISAAHSEIDRVSAWGDFSPAQIKEIKEAGYDIHFYRLGKNEMKTVEEDPDIRFVRLSSVDKMNTIAVVGKLPDEFMSAEFMLPEKGVSELNDDIAQSTKRIEEIDAFLNEAAEYDETFKKAIIKSQNEEEYSSASQTAQNDEELVWITGYIPEADIKKFESAAKEGSWAWGIEEIDKDDQNVPTKMRYGKVSGLIKPVFDILGILPGYRESDIAIWFFLFFTLFFAMIIGDAGYGVLLLVATIILVSKKKGFSTVTYLLLILSIATIIWGAITGTWFGMEQAMDVPFLRAMVIPQFANFPQSFGISAVTQQNTIIKFSFSIGAIQMAIGSLISVKKKLSEKNLSFIADLGWLVAVIAMYLLSLYLVIGENIDLMPVFALIAVAFILVVIFGGMSPDKTVGQGLKAGLADSFTVFLNTISCFGNVMSYIRLFAVGMAGVAISESFNNLGSGFSGPLLIMGAAVVIIGHALNIVMCLLSVVVHGVRLNVLEFSGQAGLEWTGIAYEPFKEENKIKK